ncbi:hypothetical protein DW691_15610 [Bacteroides xylanisolvens]|uniref:Uncharacterized protein n=1 Tax=Bacteroides xylanisolvens TaxID=371601 RepID=A0A415KL72_9BACE|nr:hypothetical protein DW691_15610 [Bacteroides xylanisolvens]RHL37029.1 hypothetical protein DW027_12765 [Bacteroides xylanisolvens]
MQIVTVYDSDTVSILNIYRHYFFYINQRSHVYSYSTANRDSRLILFMLIELPYLFRITFS